MAKRPSTSSTRAKQNQVLRYVLSTNHEVAAKHYNVSRDQLDKFLSTPPKKLKARLSQSPAYKKLYSTKATQVAKEHKTNLIPKLHEEQIHKLERPGVALTEQQRVAVSYRRETRQRFYRKSKTTGKVSYQKAPTTSSKALREAGLVGFDTIASLQAGYTSGELSRADVAYIINVWRVMYPKARTDFDRLEEDIYDMEVEVEEIDVEEE